MQELAQGTADGEGGSSDRQSGDTTASTLMWFLNGYPNTLLSRFTSPSRRSSASLEPSTPKVGTRNHHHHVGEAATTTKVDEEGEGSSSRRGRGMTCYYPLSTVIIVALIAFLMGSLLRSLLSPADFIYVVADRREIEEVATGTGTGTGWREIKRLLEVKYLVGGWDFQIAVVRRH